VVENDSGLLYQLIIAGARLQRVPNKNLNKFLFNAFFNILANKQFQQILTASHGIYK